MEIAEIHHWLVRAPFSIPVEWGSGTRLGTTRLICRIRTRSGHEGWGETQCLIDSTPAAFGTAAELVHGWDIRNVEGFHRLILGAGYYHHQRAAVYAIAALEMAMWDALGRALGQPLWALWGGKWRDEVRATGYVFASDPAEARRQLQLHADRGHEAFKIKIGMGADSDIALTEAARQEVGSADIRLDVNGAWTRPTAKRQLARLAEFAPNWVEQPLELSDLKGSAELRGQPIPIVLDEATYTLSDVSVALDAGAMDAALLDPHQAGGLWQCIKAAALCEAQGVPVGLHSGGELAISQAAYIHLAACIPNMTIPIDTERAWIGADVSPEPPALRDGGYAVSDRCGLGVDIDEALVEAIAVDKIEGAYLDAARPGWFPTKPSY
ncbi:Muconate cycloisomerase [Candidatus Rhodobacter oscarellae]|uniref:glucarate dehydratase n=1 Tax=Candidatus Rhodobacter oscarellae TaxID=1675527 RepID=A0A0J9E9I3_9RHOB|nr:mandelate racemase/muconate lactonizing enzyme family protein [Candidatus Rhodobacter lobularis]KMW58329.1 Muconate cycloisomerase [Candidatus Rhodobacter lobularis]